MSFKNMKRDDHGHVIGNDEQDGQKCQHVNGGKPSAQDVEDQVYNKEMKEAQEQNAAMSEAFDDDYEEEFEDKKTNAFYGIVDITPEQKNALKKYNVKLEGPDEFGEYDLYGNKSDLEEIANKGILNLDVRDMDEVNDDYGLEDTVQNADDEDNEELSTYKAKYEPEDFEDARFYPTKSNMDGNRWVGRYRSMTDAHGLKGWNDDNVKHIEDYNDTSIFQLPDGYYSINPNITSMSFKTVDALKNYLDRKNPEEHKYGTYFDGDIQKMYRGKGEDGKEYDMEGPDAYKAARNKKDPVAKIGDRNLKLSEFVNMAGKADRDLQDVLATIIASNYGLSEADAEKMIVDKYYELHDHNGKLNNSRK